MAIIRYAIADSTADWSSAEAQVARLAKDSKAAAGRSSIVSIKTASSRSNAVQKRKVGDDDEKDETTSQKKKNRRRMGQKAKS